MKRAAATIFTLISLLLAFTLPAQAQRRPAVRPIADSLQVAFVDGSAGTASLTGAGSDALIDLKTITHPAGSSERSTRIQRRIGIRITRPGGGVWGSAVLSARLDSWDGLAKVRVDGRLLTTLETVIERTVPIGSVTFHTIEIEVPDTMAAGPLATSIAWEIASE